MTTPLEDLAMIGDGETVALVNKKGSVEWLCLPRFDSPACCAALLGTKEHGHWTIAPDDLTHSEQRYQSDTLVLETDLTSKDGTIRITDFMPIRDRNPTLIRIVEGLSGTVPTRFTAAFRFDYGNMPPWISEADDGSVIMHVGPDKLVLCGLDEVDTSDGTIDTVIEVEEGSRYAFSLTYGAAHDEVPAPEKTKKALDETQQYWRGWLKQFDKALPYEKEVRRSLLTLKALIHRPTGGIVAAPTTSLPEQPAGSLNWDYRFCWLRDATFTLEALTGCGYIDEAAAWRDWILRAVAGSEEKMQIMYRVDGSRRLDEAELEWLPGYRFSRPVRIGNKAADQLQLDVYGELINMLHHCEKAGMKRTEQGKVLERSVIEHLERIWTEPDHGMWEDRGQPRHYTSTKVLVWVAFDRYLAGDTGKALSRREHARLAKLRDHIHDTICEEGFNEGLGTFTSFFGGQTFDASLLLLPKAGFLPMSDERMAGTVAMIEKHLIQDGFVRRHVATELVPEGAFLACCFWLAECQLLDDRREDAVRTLERAMSVSSPLGLLSEEFDTACARLNGNYPQALSHLALIRAVLALDEYDNR